MKNAPSPSRQCGRIGVFCVGNIAAGDDGVGPAVAQVLLEAPLPPGVEIVEAGLAGPGLVSQLQDYEAVVLVDAVDMGAAPGTVRAFDPRSARSVKPSERLSLHGCDLLEVLELAARLGVCPQKVIVVGVQPKRIELGAELSDEVRAAVSSAADQALAAAERCAKTRGPL